MQNYSELERSGLIKDRTFNLQLERWVVLLRLVQMKERKLCRKKRNNQTVVGGWGWWKDSIID